MASDSSVESLAWAVVFADQRLVVLNKPSGLLSVPGLGTDNQVNLASLVQRRYPTASIVHRLDRDTSGLLVMALDAQSHREFSRQFEKRRVGKRYVAIVHGCPEEDEGRIDLPLRKDLDRPPRHMVDLQLGKRAITDWRVVERAPDRTRLELLPGTGRSHQLRVHLASMGHPVLGDNLYGTADSQAMADRLMLHAAMLSITHPATGERLTWNLPAPF